MEKYKILICDDSKTVRAKFLEVLKEIEHDYYEIEAFEAGDGQESIDMYKKLKPDLVFLDIIMPEKTGLEALEEIVAIENQTKIIMASSVGTKENLKEALDIGADDFIQKPLAYRKLKKLIFKLMKRKRLMDRLNKNR